jgi:hypothetical protein|tara:strand:+ start:386 stop:1213 length:828 start_codon:yes stop_codon:yes gene_type:complete
MKYNFEIKEITRFDSTELVQTYHYSKIMPRLTKHFLGCFLGGELVGVLTLGWGTQPKATIAKLFDGLDTKDYYEIGKMCMKPEMPKNSESQMLSGVVKWMKENCPEKKFLYTWADGIMGKPGYVYQAANFLYGGFIWTQIYISDKGEKIHPRSSRRLCDENVQFKLEREPNFFEGKKGERIYWLTQDFLDHKGISKIYGKQFRYILPLNKKARKLIKKSKVDWGLNYPKNIDLIWDKSSTSGRERLEGMPHVDSDVTEYNAKNVNAHKGTLEAFL